MFAPRDGLMGRRVSLATIVALAFVSATTSATASTIIAADNAGNYGGGWTNGSNGGTGFGPWTLSAGGGTGGFGGNFIGNPANSGITNFGTQAFAQFANPAGSGAFANADRALSQALVVGDTLSLQWAVNWDSDGSGNKGFNIYAGGTGGTQLVNVNQGGSPGNITVNGTNTGFGYGTNPMTWTFQMTNSTTLSVTGTPRDGIGSSYSGSFTVSGAPDAIRFYSSNLASGSNREPYFNNLQVQAVPEPAMAPLALLGLVVPAVTSCRRMLRRQRAG